MSTRTTQRTRTSGWQNSVAASSATTFYVRTDDPSLSTMMAPALTVVLGFGKRSGLQAVSKQPVAQPSFAESPSVARASKPKVDETASAAVADPTDDATEPAKAETAVTDDVAAEPSVAELPSEQSAPAAEVQVETIDADALLKLEGETGLQLADPPAEAAAAEPETDEPDPDKPVHPHRIEMTIDSLPHHDLTEPIPIYIDPLGDTVFTASVAHLDICATGNSIGEAMVLLKEQIEFRYGDLNRRPKRSPEQTTMLQMLHTYIPATGSKPSWL